MNALEILGIPESSPEQLFIHKTNVKSKYRALCKEWHPDVNKGAQASEVFTHIAKLHKSAEDKIENDTWGVYGAKVFTSLSGLTYKIKYEYMQETLVGTSYVGNSHVAYFVRKENADLFNNAQDKIQALVYQSDKMRADISRHLPSVHRVIETDDHFVLVHKKTADVVPLRGVLNYYNGAIPPKHAAWIISGLYNIACYLKWAKLMHGDISVDSCFISPKYHSTLLLGGWWYASTFGAKLKALPARTVNLLPAKVKNDKKSDPIIDPQLVKSVGCEILGSVSGTSLRMNKDIPTPLVEWVLLPGTNSAIDDYRTWMESVLVDAYGERRFVKMEVTPQDIYDANR